MPRFDKPPVIDGKLDDEIWKQAITLKDFYQVQPGDNIAPSKPTEVALGYDSKFLYVAFHCYDEPDKVRANIPKRDNIFDDVNGAARMIVANVLRRLICSQAEDYQKATHRVLRSAEHPSSIRLGVLPAAKGL